MKVTGSTGSAPVAGTRLTPAPTGFSVPTAGPTAGSVATTSAASVGGVAGLSSLVALQGVEHPTERRRRAIRRGGSLLDRLDELKMAMLGGEAGEVVLDRLSRTLREARDDDPDPGLSALLDQIDLRAAVELAKAEIRRNAA